MTHVSSISKPNLVLLQAVQLTEMGCVESFGDFKEFL